MYEPRDLLTIGQLASDIADHYENHPAIYDLNIRVDNPDGWLIGHIKFEDGFIRVDLDGYGKSS